MNHEDRTDLYRQVSEMCQEVKAHGELLGIKLTLHVMHQKFSRMLLALGFAVTIAFITAMAVGAREPSWLYAAMPFVAGISIGVGVIYRSRSTIAFIDWNDSRLLYDKQWGRILNLLACLASGLAPDKLGFLPSGDPIPKMAEEDFNAAFNSRDDEAS